MNEHSEPGGLRGDKRRRKISAFQGEKYEQKKIIGILGEKVNRHRVYTLYTFCTCTIAVHCRLRIPQRYVYTTLFVTPLSPSTSE